MGMLLTDAAAIIPRMNDQPQPLTPGRIALVVPALNEALRIRDVVQGALRHCPNVIVVDDGSDDGTADAIADLPSREVLLARMLGSMMSPVANLAIVLDQIAKKKAEA